MGAIFLINDGILNWVMAGIKVGSAATTIKIQVNKKINEPSGSPGIL